ncbi:MAG TPA: hypothetical protein VJ901_02030 [Thermoanaerobaculia bacterium]|nr:hypothetical protein [Thermoanaerobaculia bacterium]
MTQFLVSTVSDIRGGRQSWRVIVTMSLPAFVAAVVLAQLHF